MRKLRVLPPARVSGWDDGESGEVVDYHHEGVCVGKRCRELARRVAMACEDGGRNGPVRMES
eukprot:1837646-Rhodomonas_salina.1